MEAWIQWGIGIALMINAAIVTNLMWEIRQLRAWRHKIGDDPSHQVSQLYDLMDDRVQRLERKLFNGATK